MTGKEVFEDMLPLDIADSLEQIVAMRGDNSYMQGEQYDENELNELKSRKLGEQAMLQF